MNKVKGPVNTKLFILGLKAEYVFYDTGMGNWPASSLCEARRSFQKKKKTFYRKLDQQKPYLSVRMRSRVSVHRIQSPTHVSSLLRTRFNLSRHYYNCTEYNAGCCGPLMVMMKNCGPLNHESCPSLICSMPLNLKIPECKKNTIS